ncbi:prepilin-type N-terminal cleavage/methylation domain-containing protein [Synechococcus sp. H60.1]|uniref:prepilin-type N-terminal cleavage/methylation domain-containing protein n=1 Tax=Synechococcus sp. H60.1 TaxID=2964517 RepID=UPI0039C1F5DE
MGKGRLRWQLAAEGFTLIEVLASVIIVALAMTALAPALTLVAYRRAMSERVELANRLAQEEVDRIRTLVDIELSAAPKAFQDPAQRDRLPKVGKDPLASTPPPDEMPADANAGDYTHKDNYSLRLAQVQVPGRNPEEYVIQTFRDEGAPCIDRQARTVIEGVPCSFRLGVRVYHRFSFDPDTRKALPGLGTELVSANQNLANADVWLFPLATSFVEINPAANLGDVCRQIAITKGEDPRERCRAFPLPVGPVET